VFKSLGLEERERLVEKVSIFIKRNLTLNIYFELDYIFTVLRVICRLVKSTWSYKVNLYMVQNFFLLEKTLAKPIFFYIITYINPTHNIVHANDLVIY
jgi:hypothetical protein